SNHLHLHSFPTRRSSDLLTLISEPTTPSRAAPRDEGSSKDRAPALPTGIGSDSSSLRQRVLSPERTGMERPKKPSMGRRALVDRSEEHTSELQSRGHLVC